jgi:hypothetical protein
MGVGLPPCLSSQGLATSDAELAAAFVVSRAVKTVVQRVVQAKGDG